MLFDPWSEDFGYMTAGGAGSHVLAGLTSERVPNPIWHSSSSTVTKMRCPRRHGACGVGEEPLEASGE